MYMGQNPIGSLDLGRTVLIALAVANLAAISILWLAAGGVTDVHSSADALSSGGRIAALWGAYATAAFAMGPAAPQWLATIEDYEAMAILHDQRVVCTHGFLAACPGGSPAASLRS